MKETFNLERGTINAAKDIIKNGFDCYFSTGVRFGFFDQDEDQNEIIESIIANLKEFNKEDVLLLLTEKLNERNI